MKVMFGVAAAALLAACPLSPVSAQARQPVTARVSSAGLDLSTPAGRAILDARVRGAIRQSCGQPGRDLVENAAVRRCSREMASDAVRQMAALRQSITLAAR